MQPDNKFSDKSALLNESDVKSLQNFDKAAASPVQILTVSKI